MSDAGGRSGELSHDAAGKDSSQAAAKIYKDGQSIKFGVQSGGRLGSVLGEDATELSPAAKLCTSKCKPKIESGGPSHRRNKSLPHPPLC